MYDISDYFESKTLKEAFDYLENNSNSLVIAGGSDILIKSREGKAGYTNINLVGITRIKELKEITIENNGDIFIGSCCTFSEIEKNLIINKNIPILSTAVGCVGGPQVRNVGTIGGNVCNGATSADSASTLFVLDAILIIQSANERKEVPISEFYVSAGKVNLQKGEILVGIKICKANYDGFKGHYIKFAQRNAMDIATLGCAALVKVVDGKISSLKLGFGVAGPTPLRATNCEEFASGLEINDANIKAIGEKALESSRARDSWRASKAFRENLISQLSQRAIKTALNAKESD